MVCAKGNKLNWQNILKSTKRRLRVANLICVYWFEIGVQPAHAVSSLGMSIPFVHHQQVIGCIQLGMTLFLMIENHDRDCEHDEIRHHLPIILSRRSAYLQSNTEVTSSTQCPFRPNPGRISDGKTLQISLF